MLYIILLQILALGSVLLYTSFLHRAVKRLERVNWEAIDNKFDEIDEAKSHISEEISIADRMFDRIGIAIKHLSDRITTLEASSHSKAATRPEIEQLKDWVTQELRCFVYRGGGSQSNSLKPLDR